MESDSDHRCVDDSKLIDDIEKFGWVVLSVENGNYLPDFAYTVGLWKNYSHPELISFGLSLEKLQAILNIGGDLIKSGQRMTTNKIYNEFLKNGSTQFLAVDERNIDDYFGYAKWFNKYEPFPALQLLWPDRHNKFPWDEDFEKEFHDRQPLLDRNMDFKFIESKKLAIFTTRQWIELDKPILRVIHESDSEWQFLTGDQMPDDIRIVALEELVKKDRTLNDIFNLDYGEQARRESIDSKWIRNKFEHNEE